MSKAKILQWLQKRADAHRQRWRDYTSRAALYGSHAYGLPDMEDEKMSLALANEHIQACAAIEQAIRDLEDRKDPHDIGPMADPIVGSLAYALERERQRRA